MENQSGENRNLCIESLICEACSSGPFAFGSFQQAIIRDPKDSSGGFSYTTSWEKIQNSADGGCNWCNLLAFAIRTRTQTDTASNELLAGSWLKCGFVWRLCGTNARIHYVYSSTCITRCFWYLCGSWYVCCPMCICCWYVTGVGCCLSPHLIESYTMHSVTLGDEAAIYINTGDIPHSRPAPFVDYNVATEWINKCADHEFCQKHEKVVLPTRVIDRSQPEKPTLLITKGLQGFYAALSYVWGRGQPQCTTTTNVDSYVRGINVPLPQIIVDAIMSTHKLGLRYLWVDSLCILQDSDDDKLKKIIQMRVIYKNAVVTIAAGSAYGANEGFLQDLQPAIRLPFQCPDGEVEACWCNADLFSLIEIREKKVVESISVLGAARKQSFRLDYLFSLHLSLFSNVEALLQTS